MPAEPDHRALRLDPGQHQRVFREQILPDIASTQQPQREPLAVLLGGQPGIGKSSTKAQIATALAAHGGVVDFSADLLRPYHPRFHELLEGDERALASLDAAIDQDARLWVDMMIDHARGHRLNAIVDSNLASPDRAHGFIDQFTDAGYRVEVQFVAGPAALSRLGVLQRYQIQVDSTGHGAYCPTSIQDRNYTGVLDTARMLDDTAPVDRVVVARRGGAILHAQERIDHDGTWSWHPAAGAAGAIEAERGRPWTASERTWWLDNARDMAGRLAPDYLADLQSAATLARSLVEPGTPERQQLEQLLHRLDRRVGIDLTSTSEASPAAPMASAGAWEDTRGTAVEGYDAEAEGYGFEAEGYDDGYGYDD